MVERFETCVPEQAVSGDPDVIAQRTASQSEEIATTVVSAVADADETDPMELAPKLYEFVDPDALERLVATDSDVRISFAAFGYCVTVSTAGQIEVTQPTDRHV